MKKIFTLCLLLIFYTQSYCQWQVVSEMPVPVTGAKAIVRDSVIYIVGGFSDSVLTGTKKIQAYYPESNRWEVLSDSIKIARFGHSVVSYGDSAFIFGGASIDNDSIYSIEKWGFHNNSHIKWYNHVFNRSFASTSIFDNFVYIFGGFPDANIDDTLSYIVRYDLTNGRASDSFAINDSFAMDLPSYQMSAVANNRIYVFGGVLNNILRNISYLDLNTFSWNELNTTLTKPRAGGVALTHPTKKEILLIGGKNEESEALDWVEAFSYETPHFYDRSPLSYARFEHTAVIYKDSLIYVFGGKNADKEIIPQVEKIDFFNIEIATTVLENSKAHINYDFQLLGNYPNPFNPQTDIKIQVNKSAHFVINIFDIQGKKIKTLFNNNLTAGKHTVSWDATNDFNKSVTSGIYFYTVSSGKDLKTDRMLLIK
jgi:N-acetylneuraminic acid mutarotase